MKIHILTLLFAAVALLAGGCNSTSQRAGMVAMGSGAGAAIGYAAGDKEPLAVAGGAVIGGALTALAQGEDKKVKQAGFDEGYVQGQSDAIKRQYWLRQALERERAGADATAAEGETVYYEVDGPTLTADGKKLEPHKVRIPITE